MLLCEYFSLDLCLSNLMDSWEQKYHSHNDDNRLALVSDSFEGLSQQNIQS